MVLLQLISAGFLVVLGMCQLVALKDLGLKHGVNQKVYNILQKLELVVVFFDLHIDHSGLIRGSEVAKAIKSQLELAISSFLLDERCNFSLLSLHDILCQLELTISTERKHAKGKVDHCWSLEDLSHHSRVVVFAEDLILPCNETFFDLG